MCIFLLQETATRANQELIVVLDSLQFVALLLLLYFVLKDKKR
jgi:hypothetical protein